VKAEGGDEADDSLWKLGGRFESVAFSASENVGEV